MDEQDIRRATRAGINDAFGYICKAAAIVVCIIFVCMHPLPGLALALLALAFRLLLNRFFPPIGSARYEQQAEECGDWARAITEAREAGNKARARRISQMSSREFAKYRSVERVNQ
jgi:hypothetical protein